MRAGTPPTHPNVVIVYADDLGYGDLACYGADYETPRIDSLAEHGVRCTDWYSNSPVCSPSRAALLTGRHPERTGITDILGGGRHADGLREGGLTLAETLRGHGYATGAFGKWHLGTTSESHPGSHGFDEFFGVLAGCVDYYSHIYYWGQGGGQDPTHDLWKDREETWENGRYLTELITEHAVDFVDRCAERPFFLYVPYTAPHYPMHAPSEYVDRFPHLGGSRRITAAMIAAIDDGVGAILDSISAHGRSDDTIVIFSSDNGPSAETRNWLDGSTAPWTGTSGGGFRGHKGSLFDGGIREPFLIQCPDRLPFGLVHTRPAQMIDVVPTVLALAGLPSPDGLDGVDRTDELLDADTDRVERLFWSYRDQLAMREGDWKILLDPWTDLEHPADEQTMLVDLSADPEEQHDLSGEHPERLAAMSTRLLDWAKAMREAT